MAAKKREKRNFKVFRENIYIALEDIPDADFIWSEKEMNHFKILWNLDTPLNDIAAQFNRPGLSALLIALDLGIKGEIKGREGWTIW